MGMKLRALGDVVHEAYDSIPQQGKVVADVLSWGIVGATLAKILPPLAALASLVWTMIQIYEWWARNRVSK